MTNPTPSLAQVLAEMREHAYSLTHGLCDDVNPSDLQRWAAALARLEPLVVAAEHYQRVSRCIVVVDAREPTSSKAAAAVLNEALALFVDAARGGAP